MIVCICNCNYQEQCYAQNGNGNLDTCTIGLALYNSISEDRRGNSLNRTLLLCVYEYKKIKDCNKEPSFWPIPNDIVD